MPTIHKPVLLGEILEYLDPQPGKNFIDCTLGGGGHTLAIVERIQPSGKILAIDCDKEAIQNFKSRITNHQSPITLINDNFRNLKKIYDKYFKGIEVDGILMDLGWSSDQLADRDRGLSFQGEQVLDMRLGEGKLTAAEILNTYTQDELFEIFIIYGEESPNLARRLAKQITKIKRIKKLETTKDLVDLISRIRPIRGKIHPATKVFQALRIEVNQELEVLRQALPQALRILKPGGRLIVISFHGLEDKIVKNFIRKNAKCDLPQLKVVTKKVVRPNWEEVKKNPRSRSAKMRVAEKLPC